jgi:hypothetical protein
VIKSDDGLSTDSLVAEERTECVLAISGDVFRWMMEYGPLETLQRVSSIYDTRGFAVNNDGFFFRCS